MAFDWGSILTVLVPELLKNIKSAAPEIPASPRAPAQPAGPAAGLASYPFESVKLLQKFLNWYVTPQPPLHEDGLFGNLTDKAAKQAIEKGKSYLAMIRFKV